MPYPTACNPQARATAAPMLFLRTMLGLDIQGDQIVLDPRLPEQYGRVLLTNAPALGRRWNLEATGSQSDVRLAR